MTEDSKPDPERVAFLRALPLEVKQGITREEVDFFLSSGEIPASLDKKIKDHNSQE